MLHSEAGTPVEYRRKTALVVNGDPAERDRLHHLLSRCNYYVLVTANAGAALAVCRTYCGAIHLLVTSIELPGTSGYDLAKEATALQPNLVVLFLAPDDIPGEEQAFSCALKGARAADESRKAQTVLEIAGALTRGNRIALSGWPVRVHSTLHESN